MSTKKALWCRDDVRPAKVNRWIKRQSRKQIEQKWSYRKHIKEPKRIRPVSEARRIQNCEYERLKRIERKKPENGVCCVEGCGKPAAKNPHHRNGRPGRILNVVSLWRWVCDDCHRRVKEDPHWARANDLLPIHGQYNSVPKEETCSI